MDEGIAIDVVDSCPPSESVDKAHRKIRFAWNGGGGHGGN